MAMAAARLGRCKLVSRLACTMIMRRPETTRTVVVSTQKLLRPWPAAEESKYFTPHHRLYGTSPISLRDMKKLSRSTRNHDFNFVVEKAIQHYHKHIKVEEEEGAGVMMYPVRGASTSESRVKMFHILLMTTGGRKYMAIYLAPLLDNSVYNLAKFDDGALKLALFRRVDSNVPVPFRRFVGRIQWPVYPRYNPLITAAAHFALAQHNTEEKLKLLVRATSQTVAEYEIFRMTFEAEFEFSGGSSMYDAIVLVPRENPEKMMLVKIKISDGWGMYGRLMRSGNSMVIRPRLQPLQVHRYDDEDGDEVEDEEDLEFQYKDDERVMDDPRVTAAARFALALYNEKDKVRLDGKKDEVRRVVEATRRTYLEDEILSIKFDGELDGSWFYKAIVLSPLKDPENMRLAHCGRNYDDVLPYRGALPKKRRLRVGLDKGVTDECSIDDPRVMEVARLALAAYNKDENDKRKDKLLRVVKAVRHSHSRGVTYTVRLVGEHHPLRTYVAMVKASKDFPDSMWVEFVYPELYIPKKRAGIPKKRAGLFKKRVGGSEGSVNLV